MKLKNYQNEALNRVSHYFSACLQSDAKTAFSQIQPEYSYRFQVNTVICVMCLMFVYEFQLVAVKRC